MTKKSKNKLNGLLAAFSELAGLPVVWKKASGMVDEGTGLRRARHCNAFCRLVKSRRKPLEKCASNDCALAVKRGESCGAVFENECHAGALELVAPVFLRGALDCLLFVGPYRSKRSRCASSCAFAEAEYKKLPELDERRREALAKTLALVAESLGARREALALKRMRASARDKRVQAALDLIERSFKKTLSAADAAEACGLSVSRLAHLFKEECGAGFADCLAARRIEEAKRLLASSRLRIGELAALCGYSTQAYFGMVFKKATGKTPLAWRKAAAKRVNEP